MLNTAPCALVRAKDSRLTVTKRLAILATGMIVILVVCVLGYAAWWAYEYRQPAGPHAVVDLRTVATEKAYYLTFCAGLASNFHGFPGHAYVNWSEKPGVTTSADESVGYITSKYNDQFVAPFMAVPGTLHYDAQMYNQRNLDCLTVIVDAKTYRRTRQERTTWDTSNFKAGTYDCVAFTNYIARKAGLIVPDGNSRYPQDHIKLLKKLNAAGATARY